MMIYGWKKAAAALGIWAVLTAVFPAVSIAAVKTETRTPITSVSLKVRSDVQADYELNEATVYATTDSSLYTIGAYKWAAKNNKDYWEPGDEPKVQIEIHARSGYYFNRTTGPSKFQIDGATYKSVKRTNNDETLLLTVLLTPASGTLEIPDTAEWMGYPPGKATWAQVPYAGAYELKLYRNGQMVQGIPKVIATNYDFYPLMTTAGTYQFRVRAIPKDTEETAYITSSDWVYSDELDIDADEVCTLSGGAVGGPDKADALTPSQLGWIKDDEGWWYRNTDGTYPIGTWKNIDGRWYLFDFSGYMLTGWQQKDGNYYFLDMNGIMQTGWLQDSRKWYYLGNDGIMYKGWLTAGDGMYFFDQDGSMHTGWLLDGGNWYYMSPENGRMVKNAYIEGRYLDGSGIWHN